MAQATLVRVATDIEIAGSRAVALWIVVTDDPAEAVKIVRNEVPAHYDVEATEHDVPSSIIQRLKLQPGQAHHL